MNDYNRAVALRLACAGLYTHPCCPATKRPLLKGWPSRATNNTRGVDYYWRHYGNDSMPGIALGKSGLVAIDIDVKAGVDGVAAFDWLLDDHHEELAACPVTRTPTGGYHLVFLQPSDREPLGNGTGALPRGIDVRGVGGQIIAPGALRDTGEYYEAVPGWPDLAEAYAVGAVPVLPAWLIAIITTRPTKPIVSGPSHAPMMSRAHGSDKSNWAAAGLAAAAQALAGTGEGGRNNALYVFVCTFAGHARNGWTSREEVYAAARWACTANGYLASTHPSDGQHAFERTFASGWRWGFAHPTRGPRESFGS